MCSKVFVIFIFLTFTALLLAVCFVYLGDNGVADGLEILEAGLVVLSLSLFVFFLPLLSLLKSLLDDIFIFGVDLIGELFLIFNGVTHCVDVVLE